MSEMKKTKIGMIAPHTVEEIGIKTDSDYAKHIGYADLMAQELMKKGHSVTLYYLSHRKGISEFKHKFGHRLVRVPTSFGFGLGKQFSFPLLRKIKEDMDKIDVFHIMSYYAIQYDSLAKLFHKNKKPFIVQYHSGIWSWWNPFHAVRIMKLKRTLKLANKILSVKPKELDILDKVFGLRKKSVFIPNGIDPKIFKRIKSINKKKNSLIFVGIFHPIKNLPYLIRAFDVVKKKIPNATLTIVGRGADKEKAKRVQKELGVKRIKFVGYIEDPKKLSRFYNEHEIFVLPSIKESFSIVSLEAMACGTVPIVTENVGIADVLKNKGCLEVSTAFDYHAYSSKIINILENRKRLKEMQKKGIEIGKEFTWNKVVDSLIKVYEEVVR